MVTETRHPYVSVVISVVRQIEEANLEIPDINYIKCDNTRQHQK